MSLAAWMPSSFRFFSICLLRARAARSSADEAQPMMAMARTVWLATRGSAVLLACSRLVVARRERRARARSRTRATGRNVSRPGATSKTARVAAAPSQSHENPEPESRRWHRNVDPRTNDGSRTPGSAAALRKCVRPPSAP